MKWFKWAGVLCAVLLGGFLVLSFVLMHTVCKNEVTQRVLSPSGEYVAQVWESYCTVGSDWDTDVTVRKRPFMLSYLPVGRASGVFSLYGPASRIHLHWNSDSELIVECLGCKDSEVREQRNRWKDISIRYSITAPATSPASQQ